MYIFFTFCLLAQMVANGMSKNTKRTIEVPEGESTTDIQLSSRVKISNEAAGTSYIPIHTTLTSEAHGRDPNVNQNILLVHKNHEGNLMQLYVSRNDALMN